MYCVSFILVSFKVFITIYELHVIIFQISWKINVICWIIHQSVLHMYIIVSYKMFNDDLMSKFSYMKFESLGFIIYRTQTMMILKTVHVLYIADTGELIFLFFKFGFEVIRVQLPCCNIGQ